MRDLRELIRGSETVELIRHELSTPVATALLYIGIAESYARRPGRRPLRGAATQDLD
jgi:hypothetical protein